MTIGLIGVGLLGTALASRLRGAGFAVLGYDIKGAEAASAEEVARSCQRIFVSLPGPAEVAATVDAIEPALQPGAIILDTTTGDPEQVSQTARRLPARGAAYLDCEIGGSSRQTAAGDAIVMCGGDRAAFDRCRDLLDAVSPRVFYMGAAGAATRMKLALNIAIGLHRAVLAESLEFARANGIDPAAALEVLKAGPAYSRAMDVKGARMLDNHFAPEARLAQHLKDVRLILATAAKAGARVPLSELHETLLQQAVEQGFGAEDNSAIVKVFRTR